MDENKAVWILSIFKSRPMSEVYFDIMPTHCVVAYETFDLAKTEMEKQIREFAFSKNALFDGDGKLMALAKLQEEMEIDEKSLEQFLLQYFKNPKSAIQKLPKIKCNIPELVAGVTEDGVGSLYFRAMFSDQRSVFIHLYNLKGLENEEGAFLHLVCDDLRRRRNWFCIEIKKENVHQSEIIHWWKA